MHRTGYVNDYSSFRRYLDIVFAYAGTLSLSVEMKSVPLEDMQIGDVFLKGHDPGHCVIVVDMAEHETTGEKLFMVAQSYMPAQDIHVLKNPGDATMSPWYKLDFGETLRTPQWTFSRDQLMRFPEYVLAALLEKSATLQGQLVGWSGLVNFILGQRISYTTWWFLLQTDMNYYLILGMFYFLLRNRSSVFFQESLTGTNY